MKTSHQFGGSWTQDKLNRIEKYLKAYIKIFTQSPRASYFKTIYVDAFAGPGYRTEPQKKRDSFPFFDDEDANSLQKGSVKIALEIEPSFDQYIFIDNNPNYIEELNCLIEEFPEKKNKINIIMDDANTYLSKWCNETNWRLNRSVVFLDPYGMEVKWSTVEAIAKTKAIDLWILFPLGSAVNRLLMKNHPPEGAWSDRLTSFFGTEDWMESFYKRKSYQTLFGSEEKIVKKADFKLIGKFFINRLETIFAEVALNPLPLMNSKNVPIFLLCFAAGNPKGAKIALRIAEHILGK